MLTKHVYRPLRDMAGGTKPTFPSRKSIGLAVYSIGLAVYSIGLAIYTNGLAGLLPDQAACPLVDFYEMVFIRVRS